MKYARDVPVKIALLPLAVLMFIPAYMVFIMDPEARQFRFKVTKG